MRPRDHSPRRLARSIASAARARLAGQRRPAPRVSERAAFHLSVLADPEGGTYLVGVFGKIDLASVPALASALDVMATGSRVHIDLSGAIIDDPDALWQIGELADRLEARRVGLRIVGLDPSHPALR